VTSQPPRTEPPIETPWHTIPVQKDTSVASIFWSNKNIGIIVSAPCSPVNQYHNSHSDWVCTVSQKKLGHFYFYCNFVKCWPILIIFLYRNQKPFAAKIRVIFSTAHVAALPCKTNTSMNMNVTAALFYSAIEYLNEAQHNYTEVINGWQNQHNQ